MFLFKNKYGIPVHSSNEDTPNPQEYFVKCIQELCAKLEICTSKEARLIICEEFIDIVKKNKQLAQDFSAVEETFAAFVTGQNFLGTEELYEFFAGVPISGYGYLAIEKDATNETSVNISLI